MGTFGFDLEAELWGEILVVACGGRRDRGGWDGVRRGCEGLMVFWEGIVERERREEGEGRAFA